MHWRARKVRTGGIRTRGSERIQYNTGAFPGGLLRTIGSRLLFCVGLCALVLAASASSARAQDPATPPPPTSTRTGSGPHVHELLPDIGKIGAQVGAFAGVSWNPYLVGRGLELGGYINLPLRRVPGGKLSYESFIGLSVATSEPFTITLATPRSVRTRLRLLHLSPFALKYTITRLDHARLRPYLGAGADFLVAITRQDPADGGAPLIGGFVSQVPELAARGTPTGQGNIELGGHAAAGVEIRISAGQSLNLEYRFTGTEGKNARLHTASASLGFHW
jgi:opacity protein-like surface antigen